ncbi:unnamed protein product, partial [Mesorhabditis spiculigera]
MASTPTTSSNPSPAPASLECSESLPAIQKSWAVESTRLFVPPYAPKKEFKEVEKLDGDDVKLINELSRLSPAQMCEYIRNLDNKAYVIGIEEARQFARAKMIQIFKPKEI